MSETTRHLIATILYFVLTAIVISIIVYHPKARVPLFLTRLLWGPILAGTFVFLDFGPLRRFEGISSILLLSSGIVVYSLTLRDLHDSKDKEVK